MRIGIDLGGTKTELICLNDTNGKELYRHRVPTPKNDYKATLENICELVEQAESKLGKTGTVGVGIPGTVSSQTGRIKNANSTWLNGQKLDQDLQDLLKRDIRTQNDANCLAVSEAVDGAGSAHEVVFAVIIGTGCGAGIAINGKPHQGRNSIAGEWAHNPLPFPKVFQGNSIDPVSLFDEGRSLEDIINPVYSHKARPEYFVESPELSEFPGPQCYCGKRGCLETWISGTGFKNDYHRVTGTELSTHDIVAQSRKGDEQCQAALTRYIDRLARALAGITNILDPDIIVLGGGMSNVTELYSQVADTMDRYVFSDQFDCDISPARYGDSSGVRGAAWLWND